MEGKMGMFKAIYSLSKTSHNKGLRRMSETSEAAIFQKMEVPPDHHKTKPPTAAEDAAVDVSSELHRKIAKNSSGDIKVVGHEDPDETEYSSSFADTTCSRNENSSTSSDVEVESQRFYGEPDLFPSTFDGFRPAFPMRKKKLTNHWRNFISPLMWRCKWAELKIKQFESQAIKYVRDITVNDRNKHLALDQFTSDDFGSRSLPFTSQSHRRKAMKRRKRKRVEETTDTKSYMLDHILFSYCENKKPDLDEDDEFGNIDTAITEENTSGHEESNKENCSFLEDKDDALLVPILRKINTIHSRVQYMKDKLDSVMSRNASKFSSCENLSLLVPCDMQTTSVHSPTYSACNGETIPLGGVYSPTRALSEYEMGDFMMRESAVSSYGEAILVPDIIESTVVQTSTVLTQHQSQIGDSCENIVDNILVDNQITEADGHTLSQKRYDEPTEQHHEEEESNNPVQESGADIKPAVVSSSTPKSYLLSELQFPKNKRKRGERKPGSGGGWSRQYPPGEPESQ